MYIHTNMNKYTHTHCTECTHYTQLPIMPRRAGTFPTHSSHGNLITPRMGDNLPTSDFGVGRTAVDIAVGRYRCHFLVWGCGFQGLGFRVRLNGLGYGVGWCSERLEGSRGLLQTSVFFPHRSTRENHYVQQACCRELAGSSRLQNLLPLPTIISERS